MILDVDIVAKSNNGLYKVGRRIEGELIPDLHLLKQGVLATVCFDNAHLTYIRLSKILN